MPARDSARAGERGAQGLDELYGEPSVEASDLAAPLLSMLHDRYGNDAVAEALAGGGSELGGAIATTAACEAEGQGGQPGAPALTSNAEAQDAMGTAAPSEADAQGTGAPGGPAEAASAPAPAAPGAAASASAGGSGVSVDATAPEAASAAAGAGVTATDGLTDYYMQTHWDATAFHTLGHEVGYPGNLSPDAVSTISMLMPADTSPETRAVVEVMCAAATGFLDDALIDQAASMLGLSGEFIRDMIDLGSTAAQFVVLDDPVGLALLGAATGLDGLLSVVDAGLDYVGDFLGDLSTLGMAITAATFVIGQLPVAAGTAIANFLGFGTVEALVLALTALEAEITAFVTAAYEIVRAMQVCVDVLRCALDLTQYMYAEYQADQAEAAGNFARAAQYRDLMRGEVFDMLPDLLNGAVHALKMIPFASTLAKLFSNKIVSGIVKGGVGGAIRAILPGDTGDAIGIVESLIDAASDTEWWNGLDASLGDPMQSGAPGLSGSPGDLGPLADARARTVAALDRGWASLQADDPDWYQALVNDIANPDNGPTYDQATSPTYWIGQLVRDMPQLAEFIGDASLEGIAQGCDLAAAALPGTQPVFDAITSMIVDLKPQLDEVVVQLDATVQKQQVDLDALDAIAVHLEQGLDDLRSLTDPTAIATAATADIVAQLEAMRLDPADYALPAWSPVSLVDTVVNPLNATIDGAIAQVHAIEQGVIDGWASTIGAVVTALEQKIEAFRAEIADGSELHQALEAQLEAFKAQVAEASEAFLAWDGVLRFDVNAAVAFLQSTAEAARAAAALDGPDGQGDPWPAILRDVAIPAIQAWKARHQAEVELQFHPTVPAWEMEACAELQAEVAADPAVSEWGKAQVARAWGVVKGFDGQQGREAVTGFWKAEQDLAWAVSRARS